MGSLLSVSELTKYYEVKKSLFSSKKEVITALDKVSFVLERGDKIGIVGESGSGKSTLARCMLFLEKPDEGSVIFRGSNLEEMKSGELRKIRRQIQLIFQDPYSSLNPRKKVLNAIAEPLLYHGICKKEEIKNKVEEVLKKIGLDEGFIDKFPHEMSGGQRQRVAIGRAIATQPGLLVADEPVSSLDVSVQAQIMNLFMEITEAMDLSMVFITHDLNIVRFIADRIIVMYKGQILEMGIAGEILSYPLHPYTMMLVAASKGNYIQRHEDMVPEDDRGCVYYSRCAKRKPYCLANVPGMLGEGTHTVACHYPGE